ncbi:MAG: hypothetical protein ACFCVD_02125 [Nodosilinea sp.]
MMTVALRTWIVLMDMKEALALRMQRLGYTQYKVTQEICKLRAEGDEIPPVTRYNSAVGRTLQDPQKASFQAIEELVKVMGGEIIVRWHDDVTLD